MTAAVPNGANFSIIISRFAKSKIFGLPSFVRNRLTFIRRLCRVYVLLNAKHGLNEADRLMLQDLDNKVQTGQVSWSLQTIITKADLVSRHNLDTTIDGIKRTICENAPTCLPPIVTSSLKSDGPGVNDVRRSIVEACGLARSRP